MALAHPITLLFFVFAACSNNTPSPTTILDGPAAHDASGSSDGATSCVVTSTAGYHQDTCDGMVYDVMIPPQCTAPGACGLIVDIHGLTMSGHEPPRAGSSVWIRRRPAQRQSGAAGGDVHAAG